MNPAAAVSRRRFLTGAASAASLCWLPAQLACVGSGRPAWTDAARVALARGHAWLWSAQAPDGRFASATYGLLASGQSLTPFVLESLLQGPSELLEVRTDSIDRATRVMIEMRNSDGALGLATPSPDYPCYATGMLLSCLGATRPPGWETLAQPSVAWLRSQQFRSAAGWSGHPGQGGWGMGTRDPRTLPDAGHVDLSMTRRVLLGLRAVGVSPDDPALLEARDFVARCQTTDGSFVYSPVELALNKGLRGPDGAPLGYGSATTDGLLCLGALGLVPSEASERSGRWLSDHHRTDRNPGLEGGPMALFGEAMRGYYRAGAARCFARWGGPEGWPERLATAIAAEQREDGSIVGASGLQKEDDPIVGTAFAVQALAGALSEGGARAGGNSRRFRPLEVWLASAGTAGLQ